MPKEVFFLKVIGPLILNIHFPNALVNGFCTFHLLTQRQALYIFLI